MKFGLLFDGEHTGGAADRPRADLLWEALEQVQLAEALGFHSVWSIERCDAEAHAAAPEMWLAALAQHTSRIRIGHGARLLPFAYTSPIRVAEMAAVLDILSAGRLDFAAGPTRPPRGAMAHPARGIDADRPDPDSDEALRLIIGMWVEESFAWDSERFRMPPRNVQPKPTQHPHPPLWWSGASRAAAVYAGERGLGFIRLLQDEGDHALAIADEVKAYRDAFARAQPIGVSVNADFACVMGRPDPMHSDATLQRIEVLAGHGVDTLLLHVEPGACAPAEVCDGLRRFGREVMPRFGG